MTISEYQLTVDNWIKKYGVRYFDEKTNMLLLTEEVGELARLVARKYGEQSFKRKEDEEQASINIKEEMADIFFVLTCLANQMGVDIATELSKNIEKKTKRDTTRHLENKKLK